jgi:hypothetical protein
MTRLCFLVLSFLLVTVLPAAADDMARNLRFSPGSSGAVVSGRIQGYDTATYLLSVRGGQRLLVAMSASNPQNYFNIIAPMGNQIHNSSMGDDNFSGVVRQTGTYRIQVYLMRAAARRGEESRYKLSVTVPSGGGGGVGGGGFDDDDDGGDFADGNAGGPDNWMVRGVPPGDRLMMRNIPRPSGVVVGSLKNGAVVRNRGCRFANGGRWCRVTKNSGVTGWVNGRFLREY